MKFFAATIVALLALAYCFGQEEQAPIVEKEILYKDWTYNSVRTDDKRNLRDFAKDKKLVMVVYQAPWCHSWRHDAPFLQRFYEKYRAEGLEIVAVGEYGSVEAMRNNLDFVKVTFPAVYESESKAAKQKTLHYEYRKSVGDTRDWGSPWYILLEPAQFEQSGDVLVKKAFVVSGEMIEAEGERFIRLKLGLPPMNTRKLSKKDEIEPCEAEKKIGGLVRP